MNTKMDMPTLENWLWDAACSIRGPIDAPKFKDYILPLLFYKRLCDVHEDEIKRLAKEFGDKETAKTLARSDRKLISFYIPEEYTWREIRKVTTNSRVHQGRIMSFDFFKNNCPILKKYLKFTSLESIGFYDGLWNSNGINSRWLFDKFSFDQRSYLRNVYIGRLINILRSKQRRMMEECARN